MSKRRKPGVFWSVTSCNLCPVDKARFSESINTIQELQAKYGLDIGYRIGDTLVSVGVNSIELSVKAKAGAR